MNEFVFIHILLSMNFLYKFDFTIIVLNCNKICLGINLTRKVHIKRNFKKKKNKRNFKIIKDTKQKSYYLLVLEDTAYLR